MRVKQYYLRRLGEVFALYVSRKPLPKGYAVLRLEHGVMVLHKSTQGIVRHITITT